MFSLSRAGYYADFIIAPVFIGYLMANEIGAHGLALRCLLLAALGVLLWSFAEYWIHRLAFHGRGMFGDDHEWHHARPVDYIGVSPFATALIGSILYLWLAVAFGRSDAVDLMIGIVFGYWLYIVLHGLFHHARPSPRSMLYRQMRRHDAHHAGIEANYGVSTPLWDIVFRTYRPLYRPQRSVNGG